ncbi:MAG TPA: exo-alpha-sialidase [Terriglobia bacterium]|nr:exo-alpha-sialidase [Terriglobia bacterium]
MQSSSRLKPNDGSVVLLVGTTKGAFLYWSDAERSQWRFSGPHFPGHVVYAAAYDGRAGRRRIWLSSQHYAFGVNLYSSDDFGQSWTKPEAALIKFPEDTGLELKQIWQIAVGRDAEPDTLYCGVEPAALFESNDAGRNWSLVRGLHNHPHRPQWSPGGGGLCLHTILPHPTDPNRMHVAISAGGVYRTEDGGRSWNVSNHGISAEFLPNPFPEFGQCVHKIDRHPSQPERLFLQNHGGLFRSDNGGESWKSIAQGVPSDFGFPMVLHPHDPDTAYIFPLSREMRCGPDGKVRVYRTKNAGRSWEPLTRGLPQKAAYETVLRDGLAVDSLKPAGVYFGTRSGKLYGSANGGHGWRLIADGLPPIACVQTAVVGERAEARPRTVWMTARKPFRRAALGAPRQR